MLLIVTWIFHLISSAIFLYFLGENFKWKDNKSKRNKILAITLFLVSFASISRLHQLECFNFDIYRIVNMIIAFLYVYLYKKQTILETIYWITLNQWASASAMLVSSSFIYQFLYPSFVHFQGISMNLAFDVVAMVSILIIKYLSLSLVTMHSPQLKYLRGWPLFFSILVNIVSLTILNNQYHDPNFMMPMIVSIIILFVNISYFIIIRLLTQNISDLVTIELDYQNIKLKMKYYDEIELINQEVKKYKHDLANHLNLLYYFIEINNIEEAKTYIQRMGVDLKKINKGFYYIETENEALDFILNSKLLIAREKGIQINTNIGSISELFISNVDLCTLVANLLDNSIEACERFEKENSFIKVQVSLIKHNLLINIKNSSNPVNVDEEGNYITNKKSGDHGFGMLQINRIVNQYNGFVSRTYENDIFETNILLSRPLE